MPPTTRSSSSRGPTQTATDEASTVPHDDTGHGTSGSAGDQVAGGVRQTAGGVSGGVQQVAGGVTAGMQQAAANLSGVVNPKRLLWFGGLAAVGALGVIEWPVVAAVGIGSYVAEQLAKDDVREQVRYQG